MNKLEKTLITGALALSLGFGASQYAQGQSQEGLNRITEPHRKTDIIIGTIPSEIRYNKPIQGLLVDGMPQSYFIRDNTLYIALDLHTLSDNENETIVFEMQLKQEDIPFVKLLLDAEINDDDYQRVKVRIADEYKANQTLKTKELQFGDYFTHRFSSPEN